LVTVALLGIMLSMVGRVWSVHEQREREAQLLWIGDAFRLAIARYYLVGGQYPLTLQSLVVDERFPLPRHHLRRLYRDPMTLNADWKVIPSPDGVGIMGVASSSKFVPLKRTGFSVVDAGFANSDCYCQWQFIYVPRRAYTATPVTTPPPAPGSFPR